MQNFTVQKINIESLGLNERGLAATGIFDLLIDLRKDGKSQIFRNVFNNANLTREEVAQAIGESILTFIDQNNK